MQIPQSRQPTTKLKNEDTSSRGTTMPSRLRGCYPLHPDPHLISTASTCLLSLSLALETVMARMERRKRKRRKESGIPPGMTRRKMRRRRERERRGAGGAMHPHLVSMRRVALSNLVTTTQWLLKIWMQLSALSSTPPYGGILRQLREVRVAQTLRNSFLQLALVYGASARL